ncbi:MAG TPA: serine hydrolase domain-containing protein [Rubrobacteraceae bacterium]|nr:serine hydrolase domain-containing protein [Rubrobacteraceae bacterium]
MRVDETSDGIYREPSDLDAFFAGKLRVYGVPGPSVAVVKDDRIVWARGFGFADLATSTPATPATSYLWFSMTKIATATVVMRLADRGQLDLDAAADEYFRGFRVVSQPASVTVRHLLNHSSGLANPVPIRWVTPADAPPPTGAPSWSACWRNTVSSSPPLASAPATPTSATWRSER